MSATLKKAEASNVKMIAGTSDEVRDELRDMHSRRIVAFSIEGENNPAADALAETIANFTPFVGTILDRRENNAVLAILDAIVPAVPPPQHKLIEARMTAQARKAVIESGDWLTASQVAEMAGFSATNPSAQPNKWKRDKQIFTIRHQGTDYFPGYALDASTDYRPAKVLAKVLAVFGGQKDDWGLAYWFASVNSFLGGKRPQDLLITQPDLVIAAAEDEMVGILHG